MNSYVYDLRTSTALIRSMIQQNNIIASSEDEHYKIELFLNNYSPAEIAFGSEVIQSTLPVILYFFDTYDKEHRTIVLDLERIAERYQDQIKIVLIDATYFFVLADKAAIISYPTFVYFNNGNEVMRIQNPGYKEQLHKLISTLLLH